jgi:hypothetical protein
MYIYYLHITFYDLQWIFWIFDSGLADGRKVKPVMKCAKFGRGSSRKRHHNRIELQEQNLGDG